MLNRKQTRTQIVGLGLTVLAAVFMTASDALAQGVAPPLGGATTSHSQNLPDGWDIGPVSVTRDPNGDPWMKELLGPGGGPLTAVPGDTYFVKETLIVGGNLSWNDWHEEIITPGWEWVDTAVQQIDLHVNGAPAPNLNIMNMPSTPTTGGSVWFDWDPSALPGSLVEVYKSIQYVGDPGVVWQGRIQINEYPTPEPATAGLFALGSLALLRRKRAGRKTM